jgi:hypothetical protein
MTRLKGCIFGSNHPCKSTGFSGTHLRANDMEWVLGCIQRLACERPEKKQWKLEVLSIRAQARFKIKSKPKAF